MMTIKDVFCFALMVLLSIIHSIQGPLKFQLYWLLLKQIKTQNQENLCLAYIVLEGD